MAAQARCEAYGIEINEIPATFASKMDKQFRSRMDWFGKRYGVFFLEQGDFLTPQARIGMQLLCSFARGVSVDPCHTG